MLHWISKKVNDRKQLEVMMDEQASESSTPQVSSSASTHTECLTGEKDETASSILAISTQGPQEHIADSVSKIEDDTTVDVLGIEVEFPEDVVPQTEYQEQDDDLISNQDRECDTSHDSALFRISEDVSLTEFQGQYDGLVKKHDRENGDIIPHNSMVNEELQLSNSDSSDDYVSRHLTPSKDDFSGNGGDYACGSEVSQEGENKSYYQGSEVVACTFDEAGGKASEPEAEVKLPRNKCLSVTSSFQLQKYKSDTMLNELNNGAHTQSRVSAGTSVPVLCEAVNANTYSSIYKMKPETNIEKKVLHVSKSFDDKETYAKEKNSMANENSLSYSENISLLSSSSVDDISTGSVSVTEIEKKVFYSTSCRYPYPCCSHSSCLYNQCGQLCTILGKRYILTEVEQVPLLVCLEIEENMTTFQSCKILWQGSTPVALSSVEDGTEVMFDAMVLPGSKRFVAIVVWHTSKPCTVSLPQRGSCVFLEEVAGFQVQLVHFNKKKTGVIKAIVNSIEENITFSTEVVFLNGKKICKNEELKILFQSPPSEIYTTLNKFLVIDTLEEYVYAPTCIWRGLKPSRLLLPPQIIQGNVYKHLGGCRFSIPSHFTTLHCDVPGTLSRTAKDFKLKCVLNSEVRSLVCKTNQFYCQNTQVGLITPNVALTVKVKAHVLEHKQKNDKHQFSSVIVQVAESIVTKVLVEDKTYTFLEDAQDILNTIKGSVNLQQDEPVRSLSPSPVISQSFDSCTASGSFQRPSDGNVTSISLCTPTTTSDSCLHVPLSVSIPSSDIQKSSPLIYSHSSSLVSHITTSALHSQCSQAHQNSLDSHNSEETQTQLMNVNVLYGDNNLSSVTHTSPMKSGMSNLADSSSVPDCSSLSIKEHLSDILDSPISSDTTSQGHMLLHHSPSSMLRPSSTSSDHSSYSFSSPQQYFSPAASSPFSSKSSSSSSLTDTFNCKVTGDAAVAPGTQMALQSISSTAHLSSSLSNYSSPQSSQQTCSPVDRCPLSSTCSDAALVKWSFGMRVPDQKKCSPDGSSVHSFKSLEGPSNAFGETQNIQVKSTDRKPVLKNESTCKPEISSSTQLQYSQVVKEDLKSNFSSIAKDKAKQEQPQAAQSPENKKQIVKKGKLYMTSGNILKLAKNVGIIRVTANISTKSSPMVSFHRTILYVDGKSLSGNDPKGLNQIQPYLQDVWTCVMKECSQHNVSNVPVNFMACLMWLGKVPAKPYKKLREMYDITNVMPQSLVCKPDQSTDNVSLSMPATKLSKPVSLNVPATKLSKPVSLNMPATKSSKPTHAKPVFLKGIIKKIEANHMIIKPIAHDTAKEFLSVRHKCFLYNVSLYNVNLKDVLSVGIQVDYEECSGKVGFVYVGDSHDAVKDPATRYYLISAWCQHYDVPVKTKESLLLAVGWLPPELKPTAATDVKSQVVIPQ